VAVRLDTFSPVIDSFDLLVITRTGRGTLAMTVVFGIGPLYVTIKRM
jgi:hypothetical protein